MRPTEYSVAIFAIIGAGALLSLEPDSTSVGTAIFFSALR